MPIRSPEWEINKICARFITNIAPCESLGSTGDPHFRYWPGSEVSERPGDFRFLGYSGLVVLTASLSESDRYSRKKEFAGISEQH